MVKTGWSGGAGKITLQTVALIWLAAFSVRLLVLISRGPSIYYSRSSGEVVAIAKSIAWKGTFSDPYSKLETGATAHSTPVYPLLLSSFYVLLRDRARTWLATRVMTCAIASGICAILPMVGHALGLSARAAVFSGAALALFPIAPDDETEGNFENIFGTFLFVAFLAALLRLNVFLTGEKRKRFVAAVAGAGAGLVGLTYSALFPAAVYGVAVLLRRAGALASGWQCLLATLGLAAVLAPWTARNALVLGSPILLRSNLGLELAVSNHEGAKAAFMSNYTRGRFTEMHPNESRRAAELCRQLGEAEFMRRKFRQAVEWIAGNPLAFARLTAERVRMYWFPTLDEGPAVQVRAWAATILGVAGILLGWKRHWWMRHWTVMLLLISGIYYFVQVMQRYRYTAEVMLMIAAGVLFELVWQWRGGSGGQAPEKSQMGRVES